jgi:Holliday junction DNA helicase RuvB
MDILNLMGLFKELSYGKRGRNFEGIIGHDHIKQIFEKAIVAKRPVHILLEGSPGSDKTMFLTKTMQHEKLSYFIVGSNTTKAGLVNQLFERRPKFLLVDELEKMSNKDQTVLLHLMETGIISETKIKKTRQMELTSRVFATANSSEKIIKPLLSRFVLLSIPEYTFEEFSDIAVTVLTHENVDAAMAKVIAKKVWHELGSKDVRDVIKIGRLSGSIHEVQYVVNILSNQQKMVASSVGEMLARK